MLYIEDLRLQFLLLSTKAYNALMQELQEKKGDICSEFYAMDAMITDDWKGANYDLRHVICRFVAHGFHHKVCSNPAFHQPELRQGLPSAKRPMCGCVSSAETNATDTMSCGARIDRHLLHNSVRTIET